MTMATHNVGGVPVGRLGFGAMNFTWRPTQTPDADAFAVIKAVVDAGSNFINTAEFYGQPEPTLGLQLLARFFAAEPTYGDKVFLAVKGGIDWAKHGPDGRLEFLRQSAITINTLLASHGGTKKMDLFLPARLDKAVGVEQIMRNLLELKAEGHFTQIGFSEVSATTLRTAAAIGKVNAVEFEYSPWAMEAESNGLLDACKELGIAATVYSPLGRGFLTGTLRSRSDIPEGDIRLRFDKFSEENFPQNLKLADELAAFAKRKGITPAQLALAFELAQWDGIIPLQGSTRLEGVKENLAAVDVKLSSDELAAVRTIIESHTVVGLRYNAQLQHQLDA